METSSDVLLVMIQESQMPSSSKTLLSKKENLLFSLTLKVKSSRSILKSNSKEEVELILLEDKSPKLMRSTTFPLKLGYPLIDYSQKYIDKIIKYQVASDLLELVIHYECPSVIREYEQPLSSEWIY